MSSILHLTGKHHPGHHHAGWDNWHKNASQMHPGNHGYHARGQGRGFPGKAKGLGPWGKGPPPEDGRGFTCGRLMVAFSDADGLRRNGTLHPDVFQAQNFPGVRISRRYIQYL